MADKEKAWVHRKGKYPYGPYGPYKKIYDTKTIKLPPEEFLKKAYSQFPEIPFNKWKEKLSKEIIKARKEEMKKERVEIPYLRLGEYGAVIGHDGRHTAKASEELGLKTIPVTIVMPKDKKFECKTNGKIDCGIVKVMADKEKDKQKQEDEEFDRWFNNLSEEEQRVFNAVEDEVAE